VLLWVEKPTSGTVTITGARCADGTPMRFWYGDKPELPDTVTATTGDTSYAFDAPAGTDRPGYILWSKPGNWKLTVWKGGRAAGSFVFCVARDTSVSDPCA
jgi:hypothetical protein